MRLPIYYNTIVSFKGVRMFSHLPSVERIEYQHNSQLAKKMVDICQDVLDFVHNTRIIENDVIREATDRRIKQVSKYIKDNFVPSIVKLCSNELNLMFGIVMVVNDPVFYNSAMFVEFSHDLDYSQAREMKGVFNGTLAEADSYDYDRDSWSAFEDHLNLEIGKFKSKSNKIKMNLIIYTTTFMTEECFSGSIEPPTAEELAAMYLHEIGHALTIVEHCADTFYRADAIKNSIAKFSTQGVTEAEKPKIIQKLRDITRTIDKNNPESEKLNAMIDDIEKHQMLITEVLVLGGIIATCLFLITTIKLSAMLFLGQLFLDIGIDRNNLGSDKASDLVTTKRNISYAERIADEFVSRHGLGSALLSGLLKLERSLTEAPDRYMSPIVQFIAIPFQILNILGYRVSEFVNPIYDRDIVRYKQVLENNNAIFKNTDIPSDIRDHYLKDSENLEKMIKEYESRSSVKRRELFYRVFFRLIENKSLLSMFNNANLAADYATLQKLTNGMIVNPFFRHAAKLDQLLDKK
jgi:hypothetical protein